MKNKNLKMKYLLLICLIIRTLNGYAQIVNYNKEKEDILNCIINSSEFEIASHTKKIIFKENEILYRKTILNLKRSGYVVDFINDSLSMTNEEYIVVGDFTFYRNNLDHCRVQLELMPSKRLLNVILKKENEVWLIDSFMLINEN